MVSTPDHDADQHHCVVLFLGIFDAVGAAGGWFLAGKPLHRESIDEKTALSLFGAASVKLGVDLASIYFFRDLTSVTHAAIDFALLSKLTLILLNKDKATAAGDHVVLFMGE